MRFGKIFTNFCYPCVYHIPNKWDHTLDPSAGRYADLLRDKMRYVSILRIKNMAPYKSLEYYII